MILADNCVLHQSFKKPGAGIRVSLDTGFDIRNPSLEQFYFNRNVAINGINVDEKRSKEEFSKEVIFGVGETSYFHFPDRFDDFPENNLGFSHASRPKLVELK